jgi:YggT family protein
LNLFIYVIYLAAMIYVWLIVGRAVLSWFQPRPGNLVLPLYRALVSVTEPYLRLFRRLIPPGRFGSVGVDLGSLVGLIVLFIAIQVISRL